MGKLENFLRDQQGAGKESEGEFSVSTAAMLKKYESLLPDYRDGLLFFFQAAERWKATLIDVKVKRWTISLEIRVPEESRHVLLSLLESPELLHELLPKAHPLFEIGHGYRALSQGNARCHQSLKVNEEGDTIWFTHHDDKTAWRRISFLSFRLCRLYFLFGLKRKIWNRVEMKLDTVPHPTGESCKKRVLYGMGHVGEEPPSLNLCAHIMHSKSHPLLRKDPLEESAFPVTQSELPLIQLEHAHPNHELVFFFDGNGPTHLVPVRYGIALEPIPHKEPLGKALIVFNADHLETDFSGLKLLEDEAYEEEIQRCTQVALEALQKLYEVQSGYQPEMSRGRMLYNAAKWTVGVPLWALLLSQGGGVVYASKLLFWKFFYGASAVGGFHSYARYIPDPKKYTEVMRKKHLGWLAEPELLETLAKHEIEVVPPLFGSGVDEEADFVLADISEAKGPIEAPEGDM